MTHLTLKMEIKVKKYHVSPLRGEICIYFSDVRLGNEHSRTLVASRGQSFWRANWQDPPKGKNTCTLQIYPREILAEG